MSVKNQRNNSTWDLEIVGLITSILLAVCFAVIFLNAEAALVFQIIVIGLGVIINSAIAMIRFCREKMITGIFFTVLAILLLVIFILRLFFS